jgi:hypothetical protein
LLLSSFALLMLPFGSAMIGDRRRDPMRSVQEDKQERLRSAAVSVVEQVKRDVSRVVLMSGLKPSRGVCESSPLDQLA